MKLWKIVIAAVVGQMAGGTAMAQYYAAPPPSQLPLPLKSHVQRFLDSTETPDFQCCPIRTYRAYPRSMKYDSKTDTFFSIIGNSYFAYSANDLLSGGRTLATIDRSRFPGGIKGEKYLQPAGSYDGWLPASGWHWNSVDGQAFLKDFAFDDRGVHYLAYSSSGWGVLQYSGSKFNYVWDSRDPANPSTQECTGEGCVVPSEVVSVKVGSSYYVFVGGNGRWAIYDVTTPASPIFKGSYSTGYSIAVNASGTVLGAANNTSSALLIPVASAIAGRFEGTTVALTNGSSYRAVVPDGDDFWFLPSKSSKSHVIHRVKPNGSNTAYPVTIGVAQDFSKGAAGAGLLIGVSLFDNTSTVFSTEGGLAPLEDMRVIQTDYYQKTISENNTVGGLLPVERSGKRYLIYNAYKLGDVYEMQAANSISLSRTAASFGTKNPNSPTKNDPEPFYGDDVTFLVTYNGSGTPPSTINWDFGNPTSASNTTTSATGQTRSHRYEGLSTAATIGAAKTVSVDVSGAPEIADSLSLSLGVPKARVLVPGSGTLVETSSKALGKVPIGGKFFDASDGVIEGHDSGWTLDAAGEAVQTPGAGFDVGACGAHTLSFAAKYDSYSPTLTGLTYTVQPFVAKATISTYNATSITFANSSSFGSGFRGLAVYNETWELVDGAGQVVRTQASNPVAVEPPTVSSFVIQKSEITGTGFKVRLRLSAEVDDAPNGCGAFLSDEMEIPLVQPDPSLVDTLCQSPTTLAGSCMLSVKSASNASTSGWTYVWTGGIATSTQATYSPTFNSTGNHTVSVTVTNPFGTSTVSTTLFVETPPCNGAPPQGYLNFASTPLGGRKFQFDASAFNYDFQLCDSFTWSFGDQQTDSTSGRNVTHTYSSDGTYTVKLTVSNTNGTATVSRSVTVGTVAPPPPPPPPPVSCENPTGKVFVGFSGPSSGCEPGLGKPPCNVGEAIRFDVDTFGINLASCHTYKWNFGDGTTSTLKAPTKSYSSAGTRTVTLTVSNGSVSTTTTGKVTTEETTCGTEAPQGLSIFHFGLTSGCKPSTSTPCKEGESFDFSIQGYAPVGCETISWDFGDGTTSTATRPRHAFPGVGPYTVSVAVTNTHGAGSASTTIRFFDPSVPKPVVSISPVSTKAKIGASIHFVGDFQTGQDHPIVAINWKVIRTTFGDQVIRTENNTGDITHEFNEIGDYRIELTATNAGGVSTPAVALVTVAEVQEYSFIIPVVAHLPGSNGTQWRTDLQIFNTDPLKGPLELEFDFKGGTAPIKKTFTMTSSTQIYEDFLGELSKPFPPLEDAGPVIVHVRGDSPPQMWTRTYTVDASGHGSYGQLIPAVSLDSSLETEDQTVTYVLPGLEISSRFRTNIGIVNPSTETVGVTVTARDDSALGFPIGSFDIQVPPLALVQIGNLMDRISGIELGSPFSLNLRTLGNSPIVVYGSMIDQISNDPVYITGVRDIDQQGDHKKIQVVPGAGHLEQSNGTWRSDVVIYNSDVLPIHFDLDYYDGAGNEVAEALNQPLGPGAFVRVEDVLKWPTLSTDPGDSFGLIRVETRETVERYPVVFERTYKDRGELGSFGQGIPAISPDDANVTVGEPAFIAGVRSDESFYTNLGLVAVGDEPSVVRVTLLDEGSGNAVGIWQYVVDGEVAVINPNASLIVTNVIRAISPLATRGSLKIEVVSGGGVWAYASVIAAADPTCNCTRDEHTFDPEYVPAVRIPTL